MGSHTVSRITTSVMNIPDDSEPEKINNYTVITGNGGSSIWCNGQYVSPDNIQSQKDLSLIEQEILNITGMFAMANTENTDRK